MPGCVSLETVGCCYRQERLEMHPLPACCCLPASLPGVHGRRSAGSRVCVWWAESGVSRGSGAAELPPNQAPRWVPKPRVKTQKLYFCIQDAPYCHFLPFSSAHLAVLAAASRPSHSALPRLNGAIARSLACTGVRRTAATE